MADIFAAEQTVPSTPAAGSAIIYPDSTSNLWAFVNDAGRKGVLWGATHNASIVAQGAGFATDTYVTDSDLLIPSFGLQARSKFRWTVCAVKTAAGTAGPVFSFRIGANRTTADTARLQITGTAQTAAIDNAIITLLVTVRSVSATGVIQGTLGILHNGSGTGFANNIAGSGDATSAAFDNSALQGQYIGLSIDAGASAAWTITQVHAEAMW